MKETSKIIINVICTLLTVALCTLYALRTGGAVSGQPKVEQVVANNSGAEIVIIGNSMVGHGVDSELLSNLTGRKVVKRSNPGSASAWWYLLFKNVMTRIEPKPEAVVFCFRDTYWTDPAFRARGAGYSKKLESISLGKEPLIEKLVYYNIDGPLLSSLRTLWPLYRNRWTLRRRIMTRLRSFSGLFFDLKHKGIGRKMGNVFDHENMVNSLLGDAQIKVETVAQPEQFVFNDRMRESFLPDIVKIAQDKEVNVIFVRLKRRARCEGVEETSELKAYTLGLEQYLAANSIPYIDFSKEKKIQERHYAAGDHLNAEGKEVLSRLLARALKPYL